MRTLQSFYERRELSFSLMLILLYVLPLANLRGFFGDESSWSLLFLLAFSGLLYGWIRSMGLSEKYGLTSWPWGKKVLWEIPFLLLASVNLWGGVRPRSGLPGQLCASLSMLLVGFLEEIIFRGFLFRAMERENTNRAILISALTFGIGHLVNLLNGAPVPETLIQIVYAAAIGYVFVVFFDQTGSLLPCIAVHGLIDLLSRFSCLEESLPAAVNQAVIPLFLIAVSLGYARWLRKNEIP